jgi:hypothetical protein
VGETLVGTARFSLIVASSALKFSISCPCFSICICWATSTTTSAMGTAADTRNEVSS